MGKASGTRVQNALLGLYNEIETKHGNMARAEEGCLVPGEVFELLHPAKPLACFQMEAHGAQDLSCRLGAGQSLAKSWLLPLTGFIHIISLLGQTGLSMIGGGWE